jgi:hypothetical protein
MASALSSRNFADYIKKEDFISDRNQCKLALVNSRNAIVLNLKVSLVIVPEILNILRLAPRRFCLDVVSAAN